MTYILKLDYFSLNAIESDDEEIIVEVQEPVFDIIEDFPIDINIDNSLILVDENFSFDECDEIPMEYELQEDINMSQLDLPTILALSGVVNPSNFEATPSESARNVRPSIEETDPTKQPKMDMRKRLSYCPIALPCYSCTQYILRYDKSRQRYRESCLYAKYAKLHDRNQPPCDTSSEFSTLSLTKLLLRTGLSVEDGQWSTALNANQALLNMRYTVPTKTKVSFCEPTMPCNPCREYASRQGTTRKSYRDRCAWSALTDHLDPSAFGDFRTFFRRRQSKTRRSK